jgi:predicted phage terminase large subunit-like protein
LTDDVKPESAKAFYVNGLFDPNRLPRSTLKRLREELGEYAYASQILQRPIPLGGGMFAIERIEASDKPPASFVSVVRSWDKAGTKDAGAYSVGVKMAKDRNGRFWVLDVVRGQWAADEREEVIEQTASRDGESVPILVEMEGGSGGKESGQATARRLAGYKVILYHPTGDKAARAYPFASQVGAGNVSLVKAPWNGDFLSELQYFPYSKYKDQVDAASAAFNYLCKAKAKIGGMRL